MTTPHSHERKDDHLPLTREETKAVLKEAHKEWLDEKFNDLNSYIAKAFFAAAFIVVIKIMLAYSGYKLLGKG